MVVLVLIHTVPIVMMLESFAAHVSHVFNYLLS